jgi:APA family basic amino acid/polyamine antiporter
VTESARKLGLLSGVGLVVANMVGVGVLTNTGYMAGSLGPRLILLAWLVGGVMAMAGARCYAALAEAIPRSGGEYRYLSDLLHPVLGYLGGWTSLLVGFSAPVAVAAAAAGPFFHTLVPAAPPLAVGAALIALITLSQAFDLRWSKRTQDALALAKGLLFTVFIAAGLLLGKHQAPDWQPGPPGAAFPVKAFAVSLVYIAFAYSGWNTVVYAAEELRDPRRNVPRAMLLGTAIVMVGYLVVNWIFVANLSGDRLVAWLKEDTSRITLAHVLIAELAGPRAAGLVSLVVVQSLASTVSSMTFAGPRVYAVMAREGYLPRVLAGREGRPPVAAVLLQSGLALALLLTHQFEELIRAVGSVLTLTSALTVAALFRLRWSRTLGLPRPSAAVLVSAVIYIGSSAWMLWYALAEAPFTLLWLALVAAATVIGYAVTVRSRRR